MSMEIRGPIAHAFTKIACKRADRGQLGAEIRSLYRNVCIAISGDPPQFRILGSRMGYLSLDESLDVGCRHLGSKPDRESILMFRTEKPPVSICMEDSWSGYFIAKAIQASLGEPINVLHLDDHRDMMPALLRKSGDRLASIVSGAEFDPLDPEQWEDAIQEGAVGIGNFLTPLFHAVDDMTVMHVHNSPSCLEEFDVQPTLLKTDLLCDGDQIRLALQPSPRRSRKGRRTLITSNSPYEALRCLGPGRLFVHIDLDYFINDFDGGRKHSSYSSLEATKEQALAKARGLFDAIKQCAQPVQSWAVATSPGFCAGVHWPFLLDLIEREIANLPRSIAPLSRVKN